MRLDIPLLSRKEREIISGIELHLKKVKEAVDIFSNLIKNNEIVEAGIERVENAETEADEIHRQVSLKIAEGAFFGGIREDILNLMEKIDNIADSAKDSARYLYMRGTMEKEAIAFLKSEDMNQFIKSLIDSVNALSELILAISTSKKEALSKIHNVEEYEEKADQRKGILLKTLFEKSQVLDPLTVIQLRDFIFSADNIADSAEDASDVILVMLAKGYG